jgi:excinuclease UvrABC ATPase subunit
MTFSQALPSLPLVFALSKIRDNRETLEIKFKGKSIADVLEMTVDEAAEFFKAVPAVRDKMETLQRVRLGYIKVGQQATTLSEGRPEDIARVQESYTGKFLAALLKRRPTKRAPAARAVE